MWPRSFLQAICGEYGKGSIYDCVTQSTATSIKQTIANVKCTAEFDMLDVVAGRLESR